MDNFLDKFIEALKIFRMYTKTPKKGLRNWALATILIQNPFVYLFNANLIIKEKTYEYISITF